MNEKRQVAPQVYEGALKAVNGERAAQVGSSSQEGVFYTEDAAPFLPKDLAPSPARHPTWRWCVGKSSSRRLSGATD